MPPREEIPDVPGYCIAAQLARGGMGAVYAAFDPTLEREVAIKVMHAGLNADRFIVESKVTARLPHPGVPPVYALGRAADGRPFLAMKLIEGRTLAEHLKAADRSRERPRLLGVFEQIGQTVGFAHSQGILHRDLKPANIMLGSFGEVLVMDWGLARDIDRREDESVDASEGGSMETLAGQVKGTPAYMAPEQARGEHVDARADVFALGGLLGAILTGKPPFTSDTVQSTIKKAAAAELDESFRHLDACGADAELIALAKRCLAANPADRFPNGRAVAEAVAAYRSRVDARLRETERDLVVSATEARELRKRRKVQLGLVAAVFLLLTAVAGFAWVRADRKREEARLEGERDAETRLKSEQARQSIQDNLALATTLRNQYKFREAGSALLLAEALARSGSPGELGRVTQARADTAFVQKLDGIRYWKWIWVPKLDGRKGDFNTERAASAYREAFTGFGIDIAVLSPAEVAHRVASSEVKRELVAALDDWALFERDGAVREALLQATRSADPGPWLNRLRDPTMWGDPSAVARLSREPLPPEASLESIAFLAELLGRRHHNPCEFLETARLRHPTSFELALLQYQAEHQWHPERSAIGPLETARAMRPENPTVWNNLGIRLSLLERHGAAIGAAERAIELDAETAVFRYNLGLIKSRANDPKGAIAAYREALRLDPKDVSSHNNLGTHLRDLGNFDLAIHHFEEAIRADSKSTAAWFNHGSAMYLRGDVDRALASWQEAAKLAPTLAMAHFNVGIVHENRGDAAKAIAAFRRCVQHDSKYSEAHCHLGKLLCAANQYDEALACCDRAIALDRTRADSHFNRGQCLYFKSDIPAAIAAYRDTLQCDSKHFLALTNLAVLHGLMKKFPEAIAYAKQAIEAEPGNARAFTLLGNLERDSGDIPGARTAFRAAGKLDPRYGKLESTLPPLPVAPPPRAQTPR